MPTSDSVSKVTLVPEAKERVHTEVPTCFVALPSGFPIGLHAGQMKPATATSGEDRVGCSQDQSLDTLVVIFFLAVLLLFFFFESELGMRQTHVRTVTRSILYMQCTCERIESRLLTGQIALRTTSALHRRCQGRSMAFGYEMERKL